MCSTAPACAQSTRVGGVGEFIHEVNLNTCVRAQLKTPTARVCFNTNTIARVLVVHSLVFRAVV